MAIIRSPKAEIVNVRTTLQAAVAAAIASIESDLEREIDAASSTITANTDAERATIVTALATARDNIKTSINANVDAERQAIINEIDTERAAIINEIDTERAAIVTAINAARDSLRVRTSRIRRMVPASGSGGSWGQITGGISERLNVVGVGVGGSLLARTTVLLGVGASGAEQEIGEFEMGASSSNEGSSVVALGGVLVVPANTRLAAKFSQSVNPNLAFVLAARESDLVT